MSRFDGKMIRDIEPYVAGEQPKDMKYVKLNTNENPYPPSPKVAQIINDFDPSSLRLYPDADACALKSAISDYERVDCGGIFCGNSSDEILAMAFMAFFSGKKVAFADVTYSFYPVWCDIFGVEKKIIPLKSDWTIDLQDFAGGIDAALICNPNAPTGIALKAAQIEKFVRENPDVLILCDEAYIDFGGESAVELTKNYDNLLVVKTLSKSHSLAGARVGYAIGCKALVESLEKVKNSFNSYTLDRLTIEIAAEAVKDVDYFKNNCRKVMGTRRRAVERLREMGFDVPDSSSNFVFAAPPSKISAQNLYFALKSKGVLVRYWNKKRICDRLRISIGTDSEMKALFDAINEILTNS